MVKAFKQTTPEESRSDHNLEDSRDHVIESPLPNSLSPYASPHDHSPYRKRSHRDYSDYHRREEKKRKADRENIADYELLKNTKQYKYDETIRISENNSTRKDLKQHRDFDEKKREIKSYNKVCDKNTLKIETKPDDNKSLKDPNDSNQSLKDMSVGSSQLNLKEMESIKERNPLNKISVFLI